MKNKETVGITWPKITYSRSFSAYLIGILSGIRANDTPGDIPFYMLGALVVSLGATLIITLKSNAESHNWNEALKEGTAYFMRYIMTFLGTFVITTLLVKYLFPLF